MFDRSIRDRLSDLIETTKLVSDTPRTASLGWIEPIPEPGGRRSPLSAS